MANRHMEICLTLLIIREMQIKTAMRYHLKPVRMAIIKNLQIIKKLKGMWRKGNLLTLLVGMYHGDYF